MTDTLTNRPATTNQPRPARDPQPGRRGGGWLRRLGRAIAYDALLVQVGVLTMADAVSVPQPASSKTGISVAITARFRLRMVSEPPVGRGIAARAVGHPRCALGAVHAIRH